MWHRSLHTDGYDHNLACNSILAANKATTTQPDTTHRPNDGFICPVCQTYWRTTDTQPD
jgi:hypothetical protein